MFCKCFSNWKIQLKLTYSDIFALKTIEQLSMKIKDYIWYFT